MKTAGIRELKNNLSEYLREVRRGETVLVTDRGQVVAEIAPPGYRVADPSTPPGLAALARRGLAELASTSGSQVYAALPRKRRGKVSAGQLLDQERGQR